MDVLHKCLANDKVSTRKNKVINISRINWRKFLCSPPKKSVKSGSGMPQAGSNVLVGPGHAQMLMITVAYSCICCPYKLCTTNQFFNHLYSMTTVIFIQLSLQLMIRVITGRCEFVKYIRNMCQPPLLVEIWSDLNMIWGDAGASVDMNYANYANFDLQSAWREKNLAASCLAKRTSCC